MNSFELNKIMGAVFCRAFSFVVGISVIAGDAVRAASLTAGHADPSRNRWKTRVRQKRSSKSIRCRCAWPMPRPSGARMPSAPARRVTRSIPAAEHRVGPNLWDVVMAPMADKDFGYSSALAERGAEGDVWSFESLDAFIENPRNYVFGNLDVPMPG